MTVLTYSRLKLKNKMYLFLSNQIQEMYLENHWDPPLNVTIYPEIAFIEEDIFNL